MCVYVQTVLKLRQDWLNIVVTNYTVWVPAQFINFGSVPPKFQVLFANFVGLGWNVYLSHMSHRKIVKKSDKSLNSEP